MGPNFTPLSVPHSPAPPPNRKKPLHKNAFALVAAVVLLVGVVSGYFLMQSGLFYKSRASSNFDDTVRDTSVSAVNPQNPPLCDTCDPPLPVSTSKTIDTTSQTAGKWVSDYLCGSNSTPNPWCYLVKDNLTLKVGPGKIKIIIMARHWNSGPDGDEGFRVISSVFNGNLVHPQSTTIEKEYSSQTDIAFVFDHSVYPSGSVQATVDWVYTPPVTPTKTPTPTPTKAPTPTKTPTPNPVCGNTCTIDSQCPTGHVCRDPANISDTASTNNKKCVLTKCTENGVVCDTTKCKVIPPTPTNACPKPNPVKNLRINCPICKQT